MVGRDIVVVANQPWDYPLGSNCKNICQELSRNNRILHVNPALDRSMLLRKSEDPGVLRARKAISGDLPALEQVERNVWVLHPNTIAESINRIPFEFLHDGLNRLNSRRLAASIRKAIGDLGFSDIVLFNDNVLIRAFYLKDLLKPSLSVYYIRDYLIAQPYYQRHGKRLEKLLIKKSDIVVANSLFLRDYASSYNSNSHYVGQGCELKIFNPSNDYTMPQELTSVRTPVIGYIGYLTSLRLDINLIEYIASSRPDWTVVLVGPEDETFKKSTLHQLTNIIFTGNKKAEILPSYVKHFDVCINPQLVNDLTIGNYPRKVDEYLAMGKPTVATITKAMEVFSQYCYLANGKEEYVNLIAIALKEDDAEKRKKRIALARSHNWKQNVEEMCSTIIKNSQSLLK